MDSIRRKRDLYEIRECVPTERGPRQRARRSSALRSHAPPLRDGRARVFWGRTPIDFFFSCDPLHDSSMVRRRRVDFGGDEIHAPSAEDLMIYEIVFDRAKDWRDLAEVIFAAEGELDLDCVRGWLARIVPEDDPRTARFERIVESGGQDPGGD